MDKPNYLDPSHRLYKLAVSPYRQSDVLEHVLKYGLDSYEDSYDEEMDAPFYEGAENIPGWFSMAIGTYQEMARKAQFMNETQAKSGVQKWILSVEPLID